MTRRNINLKVSVIGDREEAKNTIIAYFKKLKFIKRAEVSYGVFDKAEKIDFDRRRAYSRIMEEEFDKAIEKRRKKIYDK